MRTEFNYYLDRLISDLADGQKTRVPVLSCGVVCVILRLAVLVEHRLVPDRQTDRQTDGRTDRQGHG